MAHGATSCGHDHHHHGVAVNLDAHVLEQARGEQRTQARGAFVIRVSVAHTERQRAEHRAGIRALQAFDPDVSKDKGLDGKGRKVGQRSRQQCGHDGRPQPGRGQHGKLHRVSVHAQQAGEIVVEGQ